MEYIMINFTAECGKAIFEHFIGSELIDNRSQDSDFDILKIHFHNLILNYYPIKHQDIGKTQIYYIQKSDHGLEEIMSISGVDLIKKLISEKPHPADITSKLLSHIYAVKYNKINCIHYPDIFLYYSNWLKTPGMSANFWINTVHILYKQLSLAPTKIFPWSQSLKDLDRYKKAREEWIELKLGPYPIIDNDLGYCKSIRYAIKDIYIATAILRGSPITEKEKKFLFDIKDEKIVLEEINVERKKIWMEFRKEHESQKRFYFLGEGYTLDQSISLNTYGIGGLRKILECFTETKSYTDLFLADF